MEKWERLNVMISPQLKAQLKVIAAEKGLDLSSFVRLVLTEAVKQEGK